jgi:hypothetical protein
MRWNTTYSAIRRPKVEAEVYESSMCQSSNRTKMFSSPQGELVKQLVIVRGSLVFTPKGECGRSGWGQVAGLYR